jgi:hypothetical protein
MKTDELKRITATLAKSLDSFEIQLGIFHTETLIEPIDAEDKFVSAIADCFDVLAELIGLAEVENIKNKDFRRPKLTQS